MTESEALITLNLLSRIGPVRIRRLIDAFGSAIAILATHVGKLQLVDGIGPETAKLIADWKNTTDAEAEIALAAERGINIVTLLDENFPTPLRELYDAPVVLYVWGDLHPRDRHAIGIVGSRRLTRYGRQTARKFAFQLAHAGFTVISGLARGIDTAAHEGALAANGRTIAIIGSGLLQLYPPENMALAEKIASGQGAVVSEFPLRAKPDKRNFPQRNRVVAGWTQALLVVECPARSGSLITANLATEYGRHVYAVPGQVDHPASQGCHDLIRNGATLVTDGSQIIEDFSFLKLDSSVPDPENCVSPTAPVSAPNKLNENELKILATMDHELASIDEIVQRSQLLPSQVSATLLMLEMKKAVQAHAGQRYLKI